MTALETRLREIAARCQKPPKPTKGKPTPQCCGTLLGHAEIREVIALYDGREPTKGSTDA